MNQTNNSFSSFFKTNPEPFEITATPTTHCYRVKIDKEFEHVSQFAELVDILENATDGDVVQIRLTSPGGCVASVLPLMTAMEYTEAFVHVHVDSDIASAATFLMCKAHMVTFNKHISAMFHTASWGYGGHSGNMEASTLHYVKNIKELAYSVYEDFLTEQEFDRIFNGLEIFLTPEECHDRLTARDEKWKAEGEAGEAVEEEEDVAEQELQKAIEMAATVRSGDKTHKPKKSKE